MTPYFSGSSVVRVVRGLKKMTIMVACGLIPGQFFFHGELSTQVDFLHSLCVSD